jgi:hypothetical protein
MLTLNDLSLSLFDYSIQDNHIQMEFLSMYDGSVVLAVSMQRILFSDLHFSEDYSLPLYIGKVQITQQKASHHHLFSGSHIKIWCLNIESAEIKASIYSQVLEIKDGQRIQTHSFRDASTNELIELKTIINQ